MNEQVCHDVAGECPWCKSMRTDLMPRKAECYAVQCYSCGASGPWYKSKRFAIARWANILKKEDG